jgi:hypothetical protein
MIDFAVNSEAFKYLVLQCGDLDQFKHNLSLWKQEFNARIEDDYQTMVPFLPSTAAHIVDIGSGLGALDMRLKQHFGINQIKVSLMDGIQDADVVLFHHKTFSNAIVADSFWKDNNDKFEKYLNAAHVAMYGFDPGTISFDLVISLRAWNFHFEPYTYLKWLLPHIHDDTVVITDMRHEKKAWLNDMNNVFGIPRFIREYRKHKRLAWSKQFE